MLKWSDKNGPRLENILLSQRLGFPGDMLSASIFISSLWVAKDSEVGIDIDKYGQSVTRRGKRRDIISTVRRTEETWKDSYGIRDTEMGRKNRYRRDTWGTRKWRTETEMG